MVDVALDSADPARVHAAQPEQTATLRASDAEAVAGEGMADQAVQDDKDAYRQVGRSLFESRLLLDLPVPAWIAAALVSLTVFLLSALPNLLYHEMFTRVLSRSPAEARYGYFGDETTWSAFVWSLLLGYLLAALAMLPRRAIADTLAAIQHLPEEIMQTRMRTGMVGLTSDTIRGSRRAGAIWALLGFAGLLRSAWVLIAPAGAADFMLPFVARFAWFIVVVPSTCFVIGRAAYVSIRTTRSAERDLLQTLRFHVLDASPFDGLVRMAMRTAAVWIGGATLCSLFLFNVPMRYLGATMPLALLSCGMAAAVIWMPLININRRMRELKRVELARVLAEIERDRNALVGTFANAGPQAATQHGAAEFSASQSAAAHDATLAATASRLTALLAYRDAVRQAPEWPIGISNGSRIVVLMVLPVLGWVAAAMVERLLGTVLSLG